ncbi:DoxX family protein [Calidifontibacter terrae]
MLVRRLARPLLASMFVVGGVNQLRNSKKMAPAAQPLVDALAGPLKLPTRDANLVVKASGATMTAAGVALSLGRFPRVSSLTLAALMLPTTYTGHPFWQESDPAAKQQQMIHFFKNVSLIGGLLIASADTEGKPGLSFRAGMAKNAASRAAHTGVLEARLAAANAQNKLPV